MVQSQIFFFKYLTKLLCNNKIKKMNKWIFAFIEAIRRRLHGIDRERGEVEAVAGNGIANFS